MKQTLIDIRGLYLEAAERGEEPTPQALADVIDRRMPRGGPARARYLRGMGEFIGQALIGEVPIPEHWTPPD